jgi:hypothetical protein
MVKPFKQPTPAARRLPIAWRDRAWPVRVQFRTQVGKGARTFLSAVSPTFTSASRDFGQGLRNPRGSAGVWSRNKSDRRVLCARRSARPMVVSPPVTRNRERLAVVPKVSDSSSSQPARLGPRLNGYLEPLLGFAALPLGSSFRLHLNIFHLFETTQFSSL